MKPIKKYIRSGYVKFYGTNDNVLIPDKYVERDEELRGMWFTTVGNTDFPKVKDINETKQFLDNTISQMKEYHMNTCIFHMRPMNDAFYPSKLAPFSKYLTGTEGKDPGFDVFGYFVDQANKEGIDTHAWMNPYRVLGGGLHDKLNKTKEEYLETLDPLNYARRHPEYVIETERGGLILDPASNDVIEYVSDCALEVAELYDIKAVHMDDYFYPYDEIIDPNEEAKWKASGIEKKGDFRRDNVTRLIKRIHEKLVDLEKRSGKHVEFGISPFAIYQNNSKFATMDDLAKNPDKYSEIGSNNHPSCFSCYAQLYADFLLWMKEKYIDYVVPQDYFDLDNYKATEEGDFTSVRYADVAAWWNEWCQKTDCKLYMGMAFYRYSAQGNWSNPEEIMNQLKLNQAYDKIDGAIFFTWNSLVRQDIPAMKQAQERLKEMWTHDVKVK